MLQTAATLLHTSPVTARAPQLTLLGTVMRDTYQVASLVLAYARKSSPLDRERCWALALGTATLGNCAEADAMICIERSDNGTIRVRLYGEWRLDCDETLTATLVRLRELGFRTRPSNEHALLLELIAAP
jgi:hypothetical protein